MSRKTTRQNGTATLHVTPMGEGQAYLTASIAENASPAQASADAYTEIASLLERGGMEIVHERLFGSLEAHASVLEARRDPAATASYVRAHSQEMDEEVLRAHIGLYVNEFTVDLGQEGERAVEALMGMVEKLK